MTVTITLISFKMRESSLGTPVGNEDAVLSSFSVLPELLKNWSHYGLFTWHSDLILFLNIATHYQTVIIDNKKLSNTPNLLNIILFLDLFLTLNLIHYLINQPIIPPNIEMVFYF